MLRKVLACLIAASYAGLLISFVSDISSSAAPQVKGAQTSAVRFDYRAGEPDPNEIFKLVNRARQAEGLEPLTANSQLAVVAKERAKDMALNNYYAHESPDGKFYYDLFAENGLYAGYSCENLDLEFTDDATVYTKAWLESSNHRNCLLNPGVTEAGYAVIQTPQSLYEGSLEPTFIVVAIHSTTPQPN